MLLSCSRRNRFDALSETSHQAGHNCRSLSLSRSLSPLVTDRQMRNQKVAQTISKVRGRLKGGRGRGTGWERTRTRTSRGCECRPQDMGHRSQPVVANAMIVPVVVAATAAAVVKQATVLGSYNSPPLLASLRLCAMTHALGSFSIMHS